MPTYNALGVTVTLTAVELVPSISSTILLTMGRVQQADTKRVNAVIDSGRSLPEEPIAADGSSQGGMQFIGEYEDMAFFMVEAGDDTGTTPNIDPHLQQLFKPARGAHGATTRSRGSLASGTSSLAPCRDTLLNSTDAELSNLATPPLLNSNSATQEALDDNGSNPLALTIKIDFSAKTFLRHKAGHGKDLKFEIFLNGELVEVAFVTNRRSGGDIAKFGGVQRFSGTRFHRQTEKPWVYLPGHRSRRGTSSCSPEQRWEDISAILLKEADARGVNRRGQRTLTGDFLTSLSRFKLPDRIKKTGNYGIVDVVITAGRGNKYGPDTAYNTWPERMVDADFSAESTTEGANRDVNTVAKDAKHEAVHDDPPATPSRKRYPYYAVSPKVPQRDIILTTPSAEKKPPIFNFEALTSPLLSYKVEYQNAHGKAKSGRTIKQRLADVTKMSPTKRKKAWLNLRQELDSDTVKAIDDLTGYEPVEISPLLKRMKYEAPATTYGLKYQHEPNFDDLWANTTVDPRGGIFEAVHSLPPQTHESEVHLVKERMNLALAHGVDPDGHLMRHIIKDTPQHAYTNDNTALALSSSPTKPQPRPQTHHKQSQTKARKSETHDARQQMPVPNTPSRHTKAQTKTPKRSPSREPETPRRFGNNRTAKKWNPQEPSAHAALENFQVPELSKDSVVTYAKPGMMRQIAKARNGEFKEEDFIVGMRFVVS